MNVPANDNALEIQNQIVRHRAWAVMLERLLRAKLEPASYDPSIAPENLPPHSIDGSASVRYLADQPFEASPVAGYPPPVTVDTGPKRSALARQPGAVSQQERMAPPMNCDTTSRSDQGTSLQQQLFGGVLPGQHQLPRSSPATRTLPMVREHGHLPDVGITPDVYLSSSGLNEQSYLAMARAYPSPGVGYRSLDPSACPSIISASSAADWSQPLTRYNSALESAPGVSMGRHHSSQSWQTDASAGPNPRLFATASEGIDGLKQRSTSDEDLLGMGDRFPPELVQNYPPEMMSSYHPPARNPNEYLTPSSAGMERSLSNTSAASAQSTGSSLERRSKKAFERVRQNSNRNLTAPKPHEVDSDRSHSKAPTKRDGKLALQKTPYQRPKHPRVHCGECDEYPDGFRGDHELRLHTKAKHEGVVNKFVCRDPETVGIQSDLRPLYPLSDCRACVTQKQYGAYYNAAAHLRRTHFQTRPQRGGNKVPAEERRGGKGGGDWPPISELRMWFQEVLVRNDTDTPVDDLQMMVDEPEQREDVTMSMHCEPSPAYGAESEYALAAARPAETQDLRATVGDLFGSTAQSVAPMGSLGFDSIAEQYADQLYSPHEERRLGSMAGTLSLGTALTTELTGSDSPVVSPDYVWTMEDPIP